MATLDYFTVATATPRYRQVTVDVRPPLWRIKHWAEFGRAEATNRPEIIPMFPNHFTGFTPAWQVVSRQMNPLLSYEKWEKVYGGGLWISNGHPIDGDDPAVESLNCGGNVVTGYEDGNVLVVTTLDGRGTPKPAEWILARPWFYVHAVNWRTDGSVGNFPQGLQPNGEIVPVLHPLICSPQRFTRITIPLYQVERWTRQDLPDPLRFY